jgi:NADPH:quinone reductase-like Zn-dependent oxidoreductase
VEAVIWPKYGPPDVLQLKEVETPTPKDDEVLIRIVAATVFAGDCEMRAFDFPASFWLPLRLMFGLTKPRKRVQIPGQELAGEIVAVGKDIKHVGGLNALHFVRKGNIRKGETVLINGAAGSIGTFAVQIAKIFGAEVTAVDGTRKLDMLRTIGADAVIDYTQQDFTKNGETYDVIIDVVGKSPYSRSVRSLKKNGRYILGNPRFSGFFKGLWTSMTSSKRVIAALTAYRTEDLVFLKELIEAGKMKTVIDRRFSLEQTADAHRYVETGQKSGHVVINVAQEPQRVSAED